jgi:hypothetical protein
MGGRLWRHRQQPEPPPHQRYKRPATALRNRDRPAGRNGWAAAIIMTPSRRFAILDGANQPRSEDMKKSLNEKSIKAEIRLYVIEFFVVTLFASLCVQNDPSEPLKALDRAKKALIEGARKQTFRRFDPAMSDLLSAELEAAVTRLLAMTSEKINALKPQS